MSTTVRAQESSVSVARISMPGLLLRLEGAAAFIGALLLYGHLSGDWLPFILLFFTPDLGMLGYLVNPRVGSITYNAVHVYALPLALGLVGLATTTPTLYLLALIWAGHIGMDRTLGFGLKYPTVFKDTHLNRV